MMRFSYSKHALWRMGQRELRRSQIELTLIEPERVIPSFRGRALAQRRFGHRTLEVVFRTEGHVTAVITAYWLEE